jgi:hypothetical protein
LFVHLVKIRRKCFFVDHIGNEELTTGRWGVYRLTDPPGMKAILACHKPGIFHPHEEGNIYTDAMRPGHVCEARGMKFEVVDLRPGMGRN